MDAFAAAAAAPPPDAFSDPPAGFTPLDPRVLRLWRVHNVLGFGVFLLLVAGGAWLAGRDGGAGLVWGLVAVAFVLAWAAWDVLWYTPRSYRALGYRLDERVLLIRRGLWWQTVQLLPLSRIQHVDLTRGPLERRFGLATLVMHTAGTHAAHIPLPGLDAAEAERLRAILIAAGEGEDDAV